jgi:hypothetical protein
MLVASLSRFDPKQTQRAIPKYAKGKLDFVPKNREGQPPKSKVEALNDPRNERARTTGSRR